ncbi:hypothetical protein [Aeromonas veronii]|uniref:hypothetical protein n=1 Tax=Aeromonas veronii TaxID=654 RepID=UPI002714B0C9|nr:hypothetical protein [Aeromonas veronii]WLD18585.1 hypothetical protein O1Q77_10250 [Aeromonas veronii]HDN9024112.1 hypothetical protein [Aeromonas veronii]
MSIVINSFEISKLDAISIWSICGAQYISNTDVLHPVERGLQGIIGSFALNTRRVLESFDKDTKFLLMQSCWSPSGRINIKDIESDLWNTLKLIVHTSSFEVIFEHLPDHLSYISSENRVITFIKVSTYRRKEVFVYPFSMAYTFLSGVQTKFSAKNP